MEGRRIKVWSSLESSEVSSCQEAKCKRVFFSELEERNEDLSEKGQGSPISGPICPHKNLENGLITPVAHLFSFSRHHGRYIPVMGPLST